MAPDSEEKLLQPVARQNATSLSQARLRAERELLAAKEALEKKTDELTKSLVRLRATLEATTDGILVTDRSGRVTEFNEKYLKMWRVPRDSMAARDHRSILAIISGQFAEPQKFVRRVEEIYSTAPAESFDVLETVDGRVVERYSRIQFVEECNVGRVWSFRDVTTRVRTAEELRDQREWFRVTLSSIGDAVIATDMVGRVAFLNPVAESMTGWSSAEAVGKPLSEVFKIIHETTRREVENPVAIVLRDGLVVGLANHTALIARDGREIPIDDSAAPIRDTQGRISGVVMVFHDVSERRAAERALQEESRVLELLNQTGTAIAAQLDLDQLLQTVTDAATELSGATFGAFFHHKPDHAGEPFSLRTVAGAPRAAVETITRSGTAALLNEVVRGAAPVRCNDTLADTRCAALARAGTAPTGSMPAARSCLIVPVISRSGEVSGALVFGHPDPGVFTARAERIIVGVAAQASIAIDNARLYESSLRELEQERRAEEFSRRLAAIVESSDDAIFALGLDGVITTWNAGAERMFGYTVAEIVGKPVDLLVPADRQEEEPAILKRVARGERIHHYETVRRRKDGTMLDVSLSVSAIRGDAGEVVGVSKIARDITDRKRAGEALERLVQERTASLREAIAQMEEFSYSVSHDLRSPARAMSGYADVLLEDYGQRLDDEGRDLLRRIQRSAGRMDQLIRDLLTYSRLSRREIQFERVRVEKLIREVIEQYPELQPARADISIEGPLPDVIAHEPSLTQVISNLLSNAVKFVRRGDRPHVTIRSERHGKQVRLLVIDRGIGVKPEYQSRLFGLFERIHPEQQYAGTGIGLAIVRRAMDRMNGRAGLVSDGVTGSTFWIELPAAS